MHRFEHKNIVVEAITIGGVETCYILPNHNIAFDTGRCPDKLIDISRVFITHGHLDHAAGVPYYLSQRSLRGMSAANLYMPKKLEKPLTKILKLWNEIEGYESPVNVQGLDWGERVEVRKNHYVQALPSYHRVPSNGYVLLHKVTKLKEEYHGRPGREIEKLKKLGADIFAVQEVPLFCFSGDSTVEFVLNNPLAANSRVLFMECTYIDDKRSVERARKWGHTHLDEIIENAAHFKNEKIVLVHFSKRYAPRFIKKIIEKKVEGTPLRPRLEFLAPVAEHLLK